MDHTERDLIFALQAVQMGLVSKDVLVEVGLQWSRDREPALRELVLERAPLSDEDVELLDQVVARILRENDGDARRTLQQLGGRERVFESFGGDHLARDESLASLLADPPTGTVQEPDTEELVTVEQSGRYTVKGEHGRGGIGRVLVAYDEHVGREIAIKELIPDPDTASADTPQARPAAVAARFLREARVTGQLEHPNIVPVYEVGRRQDGTLYYTMKLVRGKTLTRTLRTCRSLEERLRLLPHYVALCQAIAYAHSRGVIHRDIKTGNVMLGEFGETVVLDWGLAKVRGQQDIGVGELEQEIRLYRDEEAGKTVDGRAIGTPAYMSPEQADGRIEDIDERSDVWSLGAVLYEVLTGRPPFEGVNAFEVIGKVLSEPVVSPTSLEPGIPPELVSICEKALQRTPELRYVGAQRLAEEVEAYQSGARVAAYEYSSWDLLKRFVARNRALSAASVLLLLVLIAASAIIFSAYRSAEVARRKALRASNLAEQKVWEKDRADKRTRVVSRQLAQAYQATAEREIALRDFMGARIYAAAALLHHPDNPRSPFYAAPPPASHARHSASLTRRRDGGVPGTDAGDSEGDDPDVEIPGRERRLESLLRLQSILFNVRIHQRVTRLGVLRDRKPGAIFALAYAPSGTLLAAGGVKGQVVLWDTGRQRVVARLTGQGKLVTALAFSPDGRWLATGGDDRVVRLWDVVRRREVARLVGHTAPVLGVAFSPDGRWLASASKDRTVRLWDVARRTTLRVLGPHEDTVFAVAFSPRGRMVASAGSDRTIRVWKLPVAAGATAPHPDSVLRGHSGSIFSLAFTPDGKQLASAGEDRTVRLWDLATSRAVAVLRGHGQLVRSLACGPRGKLLASVSFDQTVRVWDLMGRQVLATLRGHFGRVDAVAFSPDGRVVASAGRDGMVRLWRVQPNPPVANLTGHRDLVEAVAVSPDGKWLASASYDQTVRIWDLAKRASVRELKGHRGAVLCVAISPDGRMVASAGRDRRVRLWRMPGGLEAGTLDGHRGDVNSVAFAGPDRLVTASSDRTVRIWDVKRKRALHVLRGHRDEVYGIAVSPDGAQAASSSFDGTIRIWDVGVGRLVRVLERRPGYAYRLAWSPRGRWLAAARQKTEHSAEIELWDVNTGRLVRRMPGHRRLINSLAFSPDGTLLLSGSKDHTVRLWQPEAGRLAQVLEHSRAVSAVAFLPDSRRFVANDWKNIRVYPVVRPVWQLDPDALLKRAERDAGLELKGFSLHPVPLKDRP